MPVKELKTFNCDHCGKEWTRKVYTKSIRHFCDNRCKGDWIRAQKPWGRDWLYQKYVVEKLSAVDIAVIVQRDPKCVWQWIRDYGIETRKRGTPPQCRGGRRPGGWKHTPEMRERLRQMALADGRKPYRAEDGPFLKGKKGAETTNWKGGVTPERQSFYSSPEWKEAVKIVWHRDDAKCRRCGTDHRIVRDTKGKFAIHHIKSFAIRELRAEPSNLVLLCRSCHLFIHSRANTEREFLP